MEPIHQKVELFLSGKISQIALKFRNLSFDTTEERLAQYFATFGEIEFAKIVKDKSTQHSRGTAFVKFVMRDVVERVLLENSRPEVGSPIVFQKSP